MVHNYLVLLEQLRIKHVFSNLHFREAFFDRELVDMNLKSPFKLKLVLLK